MCLLFDELLLLILNHRELIKIHEISPQLEQMYISDKFLSFMRQKIDYETGLVTSSFGLEMLFKLHKFPRNKNVSARNNSQRILFW